MDGYEESIRGKVVLVTGGAGSIGSNLTRTVAELGAKAVVVLDDLSAGYRWNVPRFPNVLFVEGSVLDEVALKRVFAEKPDIVIHLAAFFANQNSVDYPEKDLLTNGMGTLRVFEYCALAGVERVIYASSGCSIYGSCAPLPLKEDFMSMHLTTPYQITKMLGELYANFFHHHLGLRVVKTRFFNSYGPGEVPGQYRNVIPNFIYWALQGQPLSFTGAGDETRDFTYVADIVDALLRAAYFEAAVGQEMNIASGHETNILEMAHQINRLAENPAGICKAQRRVWDTKKRLLASIERAKELLGYEPKVDFQTGLRNTIRWFRENWDSIVANANFPPGMSSAVRPVAETVPTPSEIADQLHVGEAAA
jgi:nucleoside-diphosphate-sugar epimerase